MKNFLRIGAARIVLERERSQRRCTDTCENRNRRRLAESEESTTAATASRRGNTCRRSVNRRSRRTLWEANVQNTARRGIGLARRTLRGDDFTGRILPYRQDRATIRDVGFSISLIVVGQNELRIRRDFERAEWSKVDRGGLIGARLDRRAGENRRTGVRAQTINSNRLIISCRQPRNNLLRNDDWIGRVVWLSEPDLKSNLGNGEK